MDATRPMGTTLTQRLAPTGPLHGLCRFACGHFYAAPVSTADPTGEGDELLPGMDRRGFRFAALGLSLVVIIFGVVAATRHHRSTPRPLVLASTSAAPSVTVTNTPTSPSIAATDVLVPGGAIAAESEGSSTTFSAELINDTDTTLTLSAPITLRDPAGASIPAASAIITTTMAAAHDLSPGGGSLPPGLEHVRARQTVSLLILVRENCKDSGARPPWPADYPHIVITLAGYPQPATFTFNGLFHGLRSFPQRDC